MKKILFVVRGYFPDISASGNLLKPLIEELSEKNFIYVLSCSSQQQEGEFSDNLRFKKVKITTNKKNILLKTISFLKKNLLFSMYNKEIVNKMKVEIEQLDNKYNFDSIIAVTYEEILALMNSSVESKKKNIFLLEKLPITSTLKFPFVYNLKISYRKKIENEIIKHFNKIYVLPIMYKYFSERVRASEKNKLICLEHPMVTNRTSLRNSKSSTIKLIYAGGLDRVQRNPIRVLEFFKRVNEQVKIEITFFSYGNMDKKLMKFSKENEFFESNKGISSELLNEKIAESDFIITIGNRESDLVPSKIFDCISTGKPIIHFSQIDEDPYIEYLAKYENSTMIRFSELSSDDILEKFLAFMEDTKGKTMGFDEIKKSFEECTPEYVGKEIQRNL